MLKVYCYKKCSTCKKAIKWLDNYSIDYKYYEITEERPQEDLFKLWLQDTEKRQHISLILVVTYIEQ